MLKELTVKRQATTLVEVDDSKNVDLVYIQTGEMREQYNKYPEILFVDTTYNVNIEAYPLLTMMVEDGDGRGKPVAYCFQKKKSQKFKTCSLRKLRQTRCCRQLSSDCSVATDRVYTVWLCLIKGTVGFYQLTVYHAVYWESLYILQVAQVDRIRLM